MKVIRLVTAVSSLLGSTITTAFAPNVQWQGSRVPTLQKSSGDSDAAATDPLEQAADNYIMTIGNNLGEGVAAPPELAALKGARSSGASGEELSARMYELMCEQGMLFDQDEDGILTPTKIDYKADYDVAEVKQKIDYLYSYGIGIIRQGIVDVDDVKTAVKDRLIARVGLSPEEFDSWLGY